MPIPRIWKLQTSARRKTAITLVFMTALLSLAASLARLVIIVQLAVSVITDAGVAAQADSGAFNMWVLESGAGVLAINMPSLWYFLSHKIPEQALNSLRSVMSLHSLRSMMSPGKADRAAKTTSEPNSIELGRNATKDIEPLPSAS